MSTVILCIISYHDLGGCVALHKCQDSNLLIDDYFTSD